MKLILQIAFFCWCLLASGVFSVESAKLNLTSQLKKRVSIWALNRMKRDLKSSSVPKLSEADSFHMQFVSQDDVKDTLSPHSSPDTNIRVKRYMNSVSQSKRTGCSLSTCSVNDLAHRLYQIGDKQRVHSAPLHKISPTGYGRRRRSLPESRVTFQRLGGKLKAVWVGTRTNQVQKLEDLLRRT
ncbi:ADML protein, partial [Atractosteus spatula]|nr:ADML protein [Atractosteus spatula]